MSFQVPGFKHGVCTAAADLSAKQYCFVKVTGALQVNAASVLGEHVLGVLQNKPTSGQSAEVMVDGITKVVAGAAIAAGARVMTDTNGNAITLGAVSGQKALGWALEAAAGAGEIVAVQLQALGQI